MSGVFPEFIAQLATDLLTVRVFEGAREELLKREADDPCLADDESHFSGIYEVRISIDGCCLIAYATRISAFHILKAKVDASLCSLNRVKSHNC